MANELTLVYCTHVPVSITVADGAGIEKGAVLKLTDPMTGAITAGDNDVIAGVAAQEKIASNGQTKLAIYRGGIFKAIAGTGGVTAGCAIVTDTATSAANKLADAAVNEENIIGISLETAAAGESFLFELRPTVANLA